MNFIKKHVESYEKRGMESSLNFIVGLGETIFSKGGIYDIQAEYTKNIAQKISDFQENEFLQEKVLEEFAKNIVKKAPQNIRTVTGAMYENTSDGRMVLIGSTNYSTYNVANEVSTVSFESLNKMYQDAYTRVTGDSIYAEYIAPTMSEPIFTDMMRNYIGIDSNVSDTSAREQINNYLQNNTLTYNNSFLNSALKYEQQKLSISYKSIKEQLEYTLSDIEYKEKIKKLFSVDTALNLVKGALMSNPISEC